MTPRARLALLVLAPLVLAGCGAEPSASGGTKKDEGFEKAADTTTCVADAKKFDGRLPDGYPADFPLPEGAVLYNVEDRGADGVVGTAAVKSTLEDVLGTFNGTAQEQGFKVTNGETEEHDAEANWAGNGFRGRWALRESAACDGEIVIQLLSEKQ